MAEAKDRLLSLLSYVKEVSSPLESEPSRVVGDASFCVAERLLREVSGVKVGAGDEGAVVEFAPRGGAGAWLRVRRPEGAPTGGAKSKQSAAGSAARPRGRSTRSSLGRGRRRSGRAEARS